MIGDDEMIEVELTMVQEAERNAGAIVAYWKVLIEGGMHPDHAVQIVSNRLVVSDAIRAVADDIEHVKFIVNDRDERFSGLINSLNTEVAEMTALLTGGKP